MREMAVTSTMLALGTEAPDFALADVISGRTVTLHDFDDAEALLVMFLCRHCPYVANVRAGVAEFARDRDPRLAIVAISANDPGAYPEDAPEGLAAEAIEAGYTFPYLFDETQEVAKAYTAACTPDFFLFDRDRRLAYRGQFDDSRPRNDIPVTGRDLRVAVDAVLSGARPSADQRPSVGCGIKWRPGNEPSFG
jgi:peroxiredoxin